MHLCVFCVVLGNTQLCSEITPSSLLRSFLAELGGPFGVPEIGPGSALCKASGYPLCYLSEPGHYLFCTTLASCPQSQWSDYSVLDENQGPLGAMSRVEGLRKPWGGLEGGFEAGVRRSRRPEENLQKERQTVQSPIK